MGDPSQVISDMIYGGWQSQVLYAGVRLGIFDAISTGADTSSEVAECKHLDPERTYRLMRALANQGLLREEPGRRFVLNEYGARLLSDRPDSLRSAVLLYAGPEHMGAWLRLSEIVREGGPDGMVRAFGQPYPEYTASHPEFSALFNQAMTALARGTRAGASEVLASLDFSAARHVCDIAGGQGHLLCRVLVAHPHLRGTVLDFDGVVGGHDSHWASLLEVADRCRYRAGDMFRAVPAADAYLLHEVLHAWSDQECVRILGNARRAGPAGARVFISEDIVPGPGKHHPAKLGDIHVMCTCPGRNRTEEELGALLGEAGWQFVGTHYPHSGAVGVVEGVKEARSGPGARGPRRPQAKPAWTPPRPKPRPRTPARPR